MIDLGLFEEDAGENVTVYEVEAALAAETYSEEPEGEDD